MANKTRQPAERTNDGLKTAYALWLVSRIKTPRTKTEWAETNGVSRDALWEWERSAWMATFIDKDSADKKVAWAEAFAELEWVAMQRQDIGSKVAAIREMGKLLGKYPSEKVDHTIVDRVAYVEPGSLRELSRALHPELRN